MNEAAGQACGTVYLVGAGPGDPELLTVKAWRCLEQADVIIYDRLVNKALLALARPDCKLIYVGKRKHLHSVPQPEIHALMQRCAHRYRRVVRLKGGDPFVFGRGGEEVQALRKVGLHVEIIPGITAAAGAAASTSLPLTHRDGAQAVTLVTAHKRHGQLDVDWDLVVRPQQTVVFYMGFSLLEELVGELLARGVDGRQQFSIISHATQPDERVLHSTLGEILSEPELADMATPALLILHNTPSGVLPEVQLKEACESAPVPLRQTHR